jgi:hypothetical protein
MDEWKASRKMTTTSFTICNDHRKMALVKGKAPRWVSSQSGLTFGYVSPPLGFIYPKPQGKGYMNLNIQKSQGGRAGVLLLLLLLLLLNCFESRGKNSPLGHAKKRACKTCAKYFLERIPQDHHFFEGERNLYHLI